MKCFVLIFSCFYFILCLCSCFFKSLVAIFFNFNETSWNEIKTTETSPSAELISARKQPVPLADVSALKLRLLRLEVLVLTTAIGYKCHHVAA